MGQAPDDEDQWWEARVEGAHKILLSHSVQYRRVPNNPKPSTVRHRLSRQPGGERAGYAWAKTDLSAGRDYGMDTRRISMTSAHEEFTEI